MSVPPYSQKDISRLRELIDEVQAMKHHQLFSTQKLENLLAKLGFHEVKKNSGSSHIPFHHDLLENHAYLVGGIFNLALKSGRKRQMSCYDFCRYCQPAIEYVLDEIERLQLVATPADQDKDALDMRTLLGLKNNEEGNPPNV